MHLDFELNCRHSLASVNSAKMSEGCDSEECAICQSSDVPSDDVLISCDMCDITVHAACYTVTKLPKKSEDW
jgi:hypothetical protein